MSGGGARLLAALPRIRYERGAMPSDEPSLADILDGIGRGHWLPADGGVLVLPAPSPRSHGVLGFTAHHLIVTDADPDWVRAQLPPGDLSAPLNPPFLDALCARTGRRVNNLDLVTVASALPGPPELPLDELAASDHPRVRRALRYRDEVRVWTAASAVLILSRGVAGRWELAVEVDEEARGRGLGRALVAAARHLVPDGALLWAQVAPGNAASVRAILAAGFTPVGAEALLVPTG
jgi:GNAT superfamily N-acetyltransferase